MRDRARCPVQHRDCDPVLPCGNEEHHAVRSRRRLPLREDPRRRARQLGQLSRCRVPPLALQTRSRVLAARGTAKAGSGRDRSVQRPGSSHARRAPQACGSLTRTSCSTRSHAIRGSGPRPNARTRSSPAGTWPFRYRSYRSSTSRRPATAGPIGSATSTPRSWSRRSCASRSRRPRPPCCSPRWRRGSGSASRTGTPRSSRQAARSVVISSCRRI